MHPKEEQHLYYLKNTESQVAANQEPKGCVFKKTSTRVSEQLFRSCHGRLKAPMEHLYSLVLQRLCLPTGQLLRIAKEPSLSRH